MCKEAIVVQEAGEAMAHQEKLQSLLSASFFSVVSPRQIWAFMGLLLLQSGGLAFESDRIVPC